MPSLVAAIAMLLSLGLCDQPGAQGAQTQRTWTEEKCARYETAWTAVMARWGTDGLSVGFVNSHAEFIRGGCIAKANVCPVTAQDMKVANTMTILAMNAGTASSFLPFACDR
jgi:hypothetical protein